MNTQDTTKEGESLGEVKIHVFPDGLIVHHKDGSFKFDVYDNIEAWSVIASRVNQYQQLQDENKALKERVKELAKRLQISNTTIKALMTGRPGSYNKAGEETIEHNNIEIAKIY